MTYALWIVQGLLALLFLFAGGMKLVLPIEALTEQMPLPGLFVRFIGVAEVLGAIGLIVPGLVGGTSTAFDITPGTASASRSTESAAPALAAMRPSVPLPQA